jgi:hypothetical protein
MLRATIDRRRQASTICLLLIFEAPHGGRRSFGEILAGPRIAGKIGELQRPNAHMAHRVSSVTPSPNILLRFVSPVITIQHMHHPQALHLSG